MMISCRHKRWTWRKLLPVECESEEKERWDWRKYCTQRAKRILNGRWHWWWWCEEITICKNICGRGGFFPDLELRSREAGKFLSFIVIGASSFCIVLAGWLAGWWERTYWVGNRYTWPNINSWSHWSARVIGRNLLLGIGQHWFVKSYELWTGTGLMISGGTLKREVVVLSRPQRFYAKFKVNLKRRNKIISEQGCKHSSCETENPFVYGATGACTGF